LQDPTLARSLLRILGKIHGARSATMRISLRKKL
jgi:hypothetical protein